jgi:outer membrane lipoprotein-sorting protein
MTKLTALLVSAVALLAAPVWADQQGDVILRQAINTLHSLKSYQAEIHTVLRMGTRAPYDDRIGLIQLRKPNLLKAQLAGSPPVTFVSDGKTYHMSFGPEYRSSAVSEQQESFGGLWGLEIDAFFGGEKSLYRKWKSTVIRSETVDGAICDVIRIQKNEIDSQEIAIGRSDHLIRRAVSIDSSHGSEDNTAANTLTKVVTNPAISKEAFAFTPPAAAARKQDPQEAQLLTVGQDAPRFDLPTPQDKQISLTGALKGKKALLLNFWFYH